MKKDVSISRIRKHCIFCVAVPFCYIRAGKMQAQQAIKLAWIHAWFTETATTERVAVVKV